MSEASQVEAERVAPADITHALERISAADVFVELRHDNVAARAAGLDALLANFADAKLIWIGNPLRSPLTIERVFLQAAGPEADLRVERSPDELAALLRAVAAGATRCLLILHQPETLDPEARDKLAAIEPLLTGASPPIQFLFCATTAFRPIAPRRAALTIQTSALECLAYETISDDRPARTGRLFRLPLLVLAVLAILMTASVTNAPAPSPPAIEITANAATTHAAALPAPTSTPMLDLKPAGAAPEAAITPHSDITALRHEFDVFLAEQAPRLANLTPDQRNALFDEFVQRQSRRDQNAP